MLDLNVDLVALANGFILVVAVIGGFGVLWRTLIHPGLKRTIHAELEPIRREFAVDGGLSLRDGMDRIERLLDDHMDHTQGDRDDLRRRIEALEAELRNK